jgi:hypothetical protein
MGKAVSAPDDNDNPEAARLAARIRRLMLISAGTTAVAIGAVLAVIGYRLFTVEGSAPATASAPAQVTATLPRGATVVGTAMAGDRIAVTIHGPDGVEIRTFDARSLQPVGRLRLVSEP